MPAPSLTYTLSNGSTADASQVMQNFNDLLNGYTDGSKDLSISALSCAGNATFNANVQFGNATSDTVTYTSRIASSLIPSAASTNDLGSSSLPWKHINLDNGATDGGRINFDGGTTKFAGSNAGGTDFQLGGFSGLDLYGTGSGSTAAMIKRFTKYHEAKSADYTVLDTDGVSVILMTRGSSNRTITLPTAADNSGRQIEIIIVDDNTGIVTIDGEGSETINGAANIIMGRQYEKVTLFCNGTAWYSEASVPSGSALLYGGTGHGSTNTNIRRLTTLVDNSKSQFTVTQSATLGDSITIVQPGLYAVSYMDEMSTAADSYFGLSLNGTVGTAISAISATERLAIASTADATAGRPMTIAIVWPFAANDVIRPHSAGVINGTSDRVMLRIAQIMKF